MPEHPVEVSKSVIINPDGTSVASVETKLRYTSHSGQAIEIWLKDDNVDLATASADNEARLADLEAAVQLARANL